MTSLFSLPPCVYFCCFLSPFSVKQRIVRGTDHGRKSVMPHMDESGAVQMCWRVALLPLRRAETQRQTSLDFSNAKPRPPPTRMTAPGSSQNQRANCRRACTGPLPRSAGRSGGGGQGLRPNCGLLHPGFQAEGLGWKRSSYPPSHDLHPVFFHARDHRDLLSLGFKSTV